MPKFNRIFRSLQHMRLSLGLFLAALFFGLFLSTSLILWLTGKAFNWDKLVVRKRMLFFEKLFVALFPTFLLAGSLNKDSFVTVTSIISFFAIFSFIFKSSIWEKGSNGE